MTELNGALDGLGLPAIVRFLAGLRMTGWLRVVHEDWHGELFFDAGRVVAASFGNRTGVSAIEALIQALPEGQFTFTTASPAPAAEPTPAENASLDEAALAGVGVETTADQEIGALTEPVATDATTPDGVPAGEAVDADRG